MFGVKRGRPKPIVEPVRTTSIGLVYRGWTFTCPPSGIFNVMEAPRSSAEVGSVELGEVGSSLADEPVLFTIREGALFGNLFDPLALAYEVT